MLLCRPLQRTCVTAIAYCPIYCCINLRWPFCSIAFVANRTVQREQQFWYMNVWRWYYKAHCGWEHTTNEINNIFFCNFHFHLYGKSLLWSTLLNALHIAVACVLQMAWFVQQVAVLVVRFHISNCFFFFCLHFLSNIWENINVKNKKTERERERNMCIWEGIFWIGSRLTVGLIYCVCCALNRMHRWRLLAELNLMSHTKLLSLYVFHRWSNIKSVRCRWVINTHNLRKE